MLVGANLNYGGYCILPVGGTLNYRVIPYVLVGGTFMLSRWYIIVLVDGMEMYWGWYFMFWCVVPLLWKVDLIYYASNLSFNIQDSIGKSH